MVPRRTVLAAFVAAVTTSSFAQNRLETTGGDIGSDKEYVRQSLATSSLSLAASRIAAEKAQMEDLKEFAHLEAVEQETLADVLKSLSAQNANPNDRAVRRPGNAEVEQNLDHRGREMLESMRAEPAGVDFDRAYLGILANGHLEMLRIQETYLDSARTNRGDFINVAKLVRAMVKEHLQLLTDIESDLEVPSATAGAAAGKQ
jgi:putative membrane protein